MRPYGNPAALDARRRRAVALIKDGLGVREVARKIGCSPTSVSRWQAEVQTGGTDALRAKPTPGRPPRLTARQRGKLLKLLLKGATAHGFSTELWTLPRVAEVIARTFGVRYHPAHVWKILRGEGGGGGGGGGGPHPAWGGRAVPKKKKPPAAPVGVSSSSTRAVSCSSPSVAAPGRPGGRPPSSASGIVATGSRRSAPSRWPHAGAASGSTGPTTPTTSGPPRSSGSSQPCAATCLAASRSYGTA